VGVGVWGGKKRKAGACIYLLFLLLCRTVLRKIAFYELATRFLAF